MTQPYHPVQPLRPTKTTSGRIVFAIVMAVFLVLAIGGTILSVRSQLKSNYVVFDTSLPGKYTVAIDGGKKAKGVFDLKRAEPNTKFTKVPVIELEPGAHTIEVFDEQKALVEKSEIIVPESKFRGVYSAGEGRRYTLLAMVYNGREKSSVTSLTEVSPHFFAVPDGAPETLEDDLALLNVGFPAKSKSDSLKHLCSIGETGSPDCPQERAEKR